MPTTIRGQDNFDSNGRDRATAWITFTCATPPVVLDSLNMSNPVEISAGQEYDVTIALDNTNFSLISTQGKKDADGSSVCNEQYEHRTQTNVRVRGSNRPLGIMSIQIFGGKS